LDVKSRPFFHAALWSAQQMLSIILEY